MFEEYEDIFPNLRNEIMDQQWTNCHFDFERRNIQVIDNSELALLDFQDLCHGPIGIDLAGILVDHYIPLNLETLKKELKRMEDAERKILDILSLDGGVTEKEIKMASSTLFEVAGYIIELKKHIKQLEGEEDE